MSSRSALIGPPLSASAGQSRRGSRERRESSSSIITPDDASVTSHIMAIEEAIERARLSPEYKNEQDFLKIQEHSQGPIERIHSGKSLERRHRERALKQHAKMRELGVENYRSTVIARGPSVKGGTQVNVTDDAYDGISEYDELEAKEEVKEFTSHQLRKAMGPSRTFSKEVFHKEPPVPEKLFTYENHAVRMKPVQNNAYESYKNCAAKRQWKEQLGRFTESDLVGEKRDDKELFREENGAGGDVYIMINGVPTNPNRTHHSMREIRALTATNLLDLKDVTMPPVELPPRPELTRRAVFADEPMRETYQRTLDDDNN